MQTRATGLAGEPFNRSREPEVSEDLILQTAYEQGLGSYLRAAREAARLSTSSIAVSLRVDARVIEAMENEDFARLPVPVYVKGYLRNYAKLVHLPESRVLELYARKIGPDSDPLATQAKETPEPQLRWGSYLLVLTLVGLAFLWIHEWDIVDQPVAVDTLQTSNNGTGGDRSPSGNYTALKEPAISVESVPVASKPDAAPAQAKSPQSLATSTTDANATALTNEPGTHSDTEIQQPADAASGQASASGTDKVSISVQANAWVAIQDRSGRRLVFQTLPAGATKNVEGAGPFTVVLGNAPATHVTFNGVTFDPSPYVVGTRARFKLEGATTAAPRGEMADLSTERPSNLDGARPAGESMASATSAGQVNVHALADTWVSIKDQNGRRLAFETVPAGTSRSYSGQPPFVVVLGNAPGTKLEYNGQAFDPKPYTIGTRARFKLGD